MWMAVAISTPARAASGMSATHRAAASTTASRTSAWVSAASREVAPARTLTAVRAIAAVAGIPPNSGEPRLARPCPTSSRSESWRCPTLIPSATVADSRLSNAASAATATAGSSEGVQIGRGIRGSRGGQPGRDPADRRGPEVEGGVGQGGGDDRDSEPGQAGAQPRQDQDARRHGHGHAERRSTSGSATQASTALAASTSTFSAWTSTPRAAGSCCSAMIAAMPTVKPSTTGTGT